MAALKIANASLPPSERAGKKKLAVSADAIDDFADAETFAGPSGEIPIDDDDDEMENDDEA